MATGSRFDVLDDEVAVRANRNPALALEEAVSYAVAAATGIKKQATSVSADAGNLSDGAFIGEIVTKVLAAIQPIIIQSVTQAVAAAMKVAMEQFQPNRSTASPASCSSPGILHPEVQTNRFEVDRLEQYSRRDSFKVFGVPESGPQEDTSQMLVDLAKEIGVELRRDDISVSHRVYVSKKSSKPRPIIAKMVRREKKVEVMKAKKRLRELNDRKDIFIVEDLTQLRVKLVRELRKEPRVEKVWTIDGKVFCLVKDGAKRVKQMIDSPDDLHKIGWSEERMKESGLFLRRYRMRPARPAHWLRANTKLRGWAPMRSASTTRARSATILDPQHGVVVVVMETWRQWRSISVKTNKHTF